MIFNLLQWTWVFDPECAYLIHMHVATAMLKAYPEGSDFKTTGKSGMYTTILIETLNFICSE